MNTNRGDSVVNACFQKRQGLVHAQRQGDPVEIAIFVHNALVASVCNAHGTTE